MAIIIIIIMMMHIVHTVWKTKIKQAQQAQAGYTADTSISEIVADKHTRSK